MSDEGWLRRQPEWNPPAQRTLLDSWLDIIGAAAACAFTALLLGWPLYGLIARLLS